MKKIFYILLFLLSLGFFSSKFIPFYQRSCIPTPPEPKIKKAIVVGASSGMGRAVAKLLAKEGYEVGLVARRKKLLRSLQREIPTKTYVKKIDVSQAKKARKRLRRLIFQMGGLDLMLVSVSALGDVEKGKSFLERSFEDSKKFIDTDVLGFWVAAHVALKHFDKQGHGHLVGMSSIDAIRGTPLGPQYSGAKSFIAKYLEGIRHRMILDGKPTYTTTIMPGWVDVERQTYSELPGTYWVASTQEAAQQIVEAIKAKKEKAYITKRWALIAWLFAIAPDWLYRLIDG